MSIYVIKLKGITGNKRTTGHSIPDLGQTHVKCDVLVKYAKKIVAITTEHIHV